jgi:hypothetical protein
MTASLAHTSDSPAVVVFPPLLFGGALAAGLVLHWPLLLLLPVLVVLDRGARVRRSM